MRCQAVCVVERWSTPDTSTLLLIPRLMKTNHYTLTSVPESIIFQDFGGGLLESHVQLIPETSRERCQ